MRIPEAEETDLERLLEYTLSRDRDLRIEALECLGSTDVFVSTAQVSVLFDRLLALCDDRDHEVRHWAVSDLCGWFGRLTDPGEMIPAGYRSRVQARLEDLARDKDKDVATMAQSELVLYLQKKRPAQESNLFGPEGPPG